MNRRASLARVNLSIHVAIHMHARSYIAIHCKNKLSVSVTSFLVSTDCAKLTPNFGVNIWCHCYTLYGVTFTPNLVLQLHL